MTTTIKGPELSPGDLAQGVTAHTISLLLGHPDPATLLTPEFQTALQSALASPTAFKLLQYAPEQGTPSLIQFLVEKINREQGLALQPSHLMLVAGSTQAVDMLARLYVKPGSVVIVEAPSYADAIHIFRDHRIDLRCVPMDNDGLIVAELEHLLAKLGAENKAVSLLYTIPTFHNPSGITLSAERRQRILELARQYGFLIVEDDVYRELAFQDELPPTFLALSNGEGVFSIGSFSKSLAPGLRLGWLVSSADAIQNCVDCGTTQMGGGANPFTAQVVAEYCRQGHWETHIQSLRELYHQRRDVALDALRRHMPERVSWTQPTGGFFIWISLPESVFAQDVKRMALERGVMLAAGEGYFIQPADGAHRLRITYSFAPLHQLEAAIQIVGQVIRELQGAAG